MPAKLYAKDRRRWHHRKGVAVGLAVVGGGVVLYLGWKAYRAVKRATYQPGQDWSGCDTPSASIPTPRFACGDTVNDSVFNVTGKVTGRTFSAAQGYGGLWVYDMDADDNMHEEGNLTTASGDGSVPYSEGPGYQQY